MNISMAKRCVYGKEVSGTRIQILRPKQGLDAFSVATSRYGVKKVSDMSLRGFLILPQ